MFLFVDGISKMANEALDAVILAHWQINILLMLLLLKRRGGRGSRRFWVREIYRYRDLEGHGSVLLPRLRDRDTAYFREYV